MSLHVHLRWGVTLVGKFSIRHCSPRCGTPFHVQRVYKGTALRRGRDYEGDQCVALILLCKKSVLYKRIVTKFFWDYYLNSRVCNYSKKVVIEVLRTVIKCFNFIF